MKPEFYFDPEIYEQEYERIFSRSSFVCDASLVNLDNSYYSYLNFGRPVTIRRTNDEYRAIQNICLHRSNTIDPVGQGVRDFKCNYHGWKYEQNGVLSRAPLVDMTCLQRKMLNSKKLSNYKGLLFIDESGEISKELGLFNDLNYVDCGTFYRADLIHECNWKLLVENVVESYHISFAHPESFVPTGISSTSLNSVKFYGNSSYFEIENKNNKNKNPMKNYRHGFLFPNLFISITDGVVGFMSQIVPIGPEKTVLKWRLFETPLMTGLNESVKKYIQKNSIDFSTRVLNEDLELLNSSQVGIKHSSHQFQLQGVEDRIRHFHNAYLARMELIA